MVNGMAGSRINFVWSEMWKNLLAKQLFLPNGKIYLPLAGGLCPSIRDGPHPNLQTTYSVYCFLAYF